MGEAVMLFNQLDENEELMREVARQNTILRRILTGPVEEISDEHYRTLFTNVCPPPRIKDGTSESI